jgi:Ni,Fe-hydrogenase maturation factor
MNKKAIVYLIGNPIMPEDSLPHVFAPRLKADFPEINFDELDSVDEIPHEDPLILVDTVKGIKNVMVFNDVDSFEGVPHYSLHDFDLGTTLKILKKFGRLGRVMIIGLPGDMERQEEIYKELKEMIESITHNP